MKHIALIAIALSLALAASAHAAPAQDPAQAPAANDAAKAEATAEAGTTAKEDLGDRNCLKHTGSRISARADKQGRKCLSANGRSYSKEDLDRTGEIDLANALRKLDPAVH